MRLVPWEACKRLGWVGRVLVEERNVVRRRLIMVERHSAAKGGCYPNDRCLPITGLG